MTKTLLKSYNYWTRKQLEKIVLRGKQFTDVYTRDDGGGGICKGRIKYRAIQGSSHNYTFVKNNYSMVKDICCWLFCKQICKIYYLVKAETNDLFKTFRLYRKTQLFLLIKHKSPCMRGIVCLLSGSWSLVSVALIKTFRNLSSERSVSVAIIKYWQIYGIALREVKFPWQRLEIKLYLKKLLDWASPTVCPSWLRWEFSLYRCKRILIYDNFPNLIELSKHLCVFFTSLNHFWIITTNLINSIILWSSNYHKISLKSD